MIIMIIIIMIIVILMTVMITLLKFGDSQLVYCPDILRYQATDLISYNIMDSM